MDSISDALASLQQGEWERLSGAGLRDAGALHAAVGHILRGYRYLELIHERHVPTARRYKELLATLIGKMDPAFEGGAIEYDEEMASMDLEMGDLMDVAHIDLETFYLFSKTVLDRTAAFVELYFGSERGASIRTHERMVANFSTFVTRRDLAVSPQLRDALGTVHDSIYQHSSESATNDSRQAQSPSDLMMAHTDGAPGGSGMTRLSLTTGQLLIVVDAYVRAAIELIRANPDGARILQKRRARAEAAQRAAVSPELPILLGAE